MTTPAAAPGSASVDGFHTEPDGTAVVRTSADADALTMPPLLVLDRVEAYLDTQGLGSGPLAWRRIGDGQSNITYQIRRGGAEFVLRRGPRPPIAKSTHDMMREARVQQGVAKVGLPVPQILAASDDESILGVPFYVMEMLDGEVLVDTVPDFLATDEDRRAASEVLVDTLVDLHAVDLEQAGLTDFGRPDGYLERQIATFTRLAPVTRRRELPLQEELSQWLTDHLPRSQKVTLVHGDYRFGNVMLAPDAPPRVRAILDWEMATLGDPLADLGYLTATYVDGAPGHPSIMSLSNASAAPGFFNRDQITERYAQRTGLDVSELAWYQVLAYWKASVFLEDMYTRWNAGERPGDDYAPRMADGIPELLEAAQALTR